MARETHLEGQEIAGRYLVESLVGTGGMSEVYRAQDQVLNIPVALKILKPSIAGAGDMRRRFLDEARRAAQVRNAHVVLIYDFGEDQGIDYIVMQFLEGEPLDVYSRRKGPLSLEETSRTVSQIASGLEAAHERDLIHRDVKTSNVIRDPRGNVTLTDFGLVREQQATRYTRAGTVMGTPIYMSPEQIKTPLDIDRRTDVYALGHLAYELLTGAPAIDDELGEYSIYEMQINDGFPPPSTLSRVLPHGVDEVIETALEKDRDRRYGSVGEFADALARVSGGAMPEPLPPNGEEDGPGDGPNPVLWGVMLLAVLGLAGWFAFRPTAEDPPSGDRDATAQVSDDGTDDLAGVAAGKTATSEAQARSDEATQRAILDEETEEAIAEREESDDATADAATAAAEAAADALATDDAAAAAAAETASAAAQATEAVVQATRVAAAAAAAAAETAAAVGVAVEFYPANGVYALKSGTECTAVIWRTVSGEPRNMRLSRLGYGEKDVDPAGQEEACFASPQEVKMEFRLRYEKPNGEPVEMPVDIVRE